MAGPPIRERQSEVKGRPQPRTQRERGTHRACKQNAPETPHSSGQGGSTFYVRERRLSNSRERLSRAILQVSQQHEPACGQRLALLTKLRKPPDFRRNPRAVLFTTPRDDCQFCYNKNLACDSRQRTTLSVTMLSRLETADSQPNESKTCPASPFGCTTPMKVFSRPFRKKIAEIEYRISSAELCSDTSL